MIGINEITRVNMIGQRNKISKLLYSCAQTSRHKRGESKMKELTNNNE